MLKRNLFRLALFLLLLWLASPYLSLLFYTLKGGFHLPSFFGETAFTTLALVLCVMVFTGAIGIALSFLITFSEMRYKKLWMVLLLLPLTFPPYLMAYVWGDLLDSSGIVQSFYREMMGFKLRRDYSFIEPKSFGGAVFFFTLALYPYVFLSSLAFLRQMNPHLLAAGLSLGANKLQALRRITFKIALPSLIAGLILVGFETLNDVAVARFCGIITLPLLIMTQWLEQNNLGNASMLSLLMLSFIVILLFLQNKFMKNNHVKANSHHIILYKQSNIVEIIMLLPFIFGFVIPIFYLFYLTIERFDVKNIFYIAYNSFYIAFFTAVIAGITTILLFILGRKAKMNFAFMRFFSLGYALPGSILAIGMLGVYLIFPHSWLMNSLFGLILALSLRFLLQIYEQVSRASSLISPHIAMASRSLGAGEWLTFFKVELPLVRPSFYTGLLLVMIEAVKELPLTLMLRPIGVDNLALHIYDAVERGAFHTIALPALLMSLLGLLPVYLLVKRKLN